MKIIIHGILNLNFCNPLEKRYEWGFNNLIYDMNFAKKIGALGCIIHMGTYVTKNYKLSKKDCISNYIKSINFVLENTPKI